MARYLSPEWLGELHEAASTSERLKASTREIALVVEHVVRDAPEGEVRFQLVIDHGAIAVRGGSEAEAEATVTFTESYETAAALTRGELSVQAAFMKGDIKVGGNLAALTKCQPVLAEIDDLFEPVRARTEY